MHKIAFTLIFIVLSTTHAWAQFTYAQPQCGFELTLPEAPYETKKCDKDKNNCYTLSTYTRVFDDNTSLQIDLICSPITQETHQQYSEDVMKETLRQMMNKDAIQSHEIYTQQSNDHKIAFLIGEGMLGKKPSLFIAQLWIDNQSALSVQGAIAGSNINEADKILSRIMASVKKKVDKDQAAKPEAE